MKYARNSNKGFSLIEAMVACTLVAVGITSAIRGYSALTRSQATIQERERMQRLAVSKYDEILATGLDTSATSGDFQDYNDPRYKWTLTVETTTTTGLDTVKIVVAAVDTNDTNQVEVSGMVFTPEPPTTTTGAAQ